MKIIVVGAGASGIMFAIARKRSHPKDEIIVLEHLDTPLKKILATGNGKCNLANKKLTKDIYNSDFVYNLMEKYDFNTQRDFLDSINIKTTLVGDLLYPISMSATTVRNALLKMCEKYKIQIISNVEVNDYLVNDNSVEVMTNNDSYICDKLVIATGGKSSPKLGSDGILFDTLIEHGYQNININPGLCPIYTIENTHTLDGIRVNARVSLFKNNTKIHDENGEVLFKKHGLSGIVIFNISRLIAKDRNSEYKICLDLLPEIDRDELGLYLSTHSPKELLDAYLNPKLADYIFNKKLKGFDLINEIKNMKFTFKDLYGFEYSQVSVGGIQLKDVNNYLESNIEKNVYFIGECLDVDAPCGGYNLMWAFASALNLSDYM